MQLIEFFKRRSKMVLVGVILIALGVLTPQLKIEEEVREEVRLPKPIDAKQFMLLSWRRFAQAAGLFCLVVGYASDMKKENIEAARRSYEEQHAKRM